MASIFVFWWAFENVYTDIKRNMRLSYKNTGTASSPNLQIQDEKTYYPFGMGHQGYNGNLVGNEKLPDLSKQGAGQGTGVRDADGNILQHYDYNYRLSPFD